jgi:hypothetical protein
MHMVWYDISGDIKVLVPGSGLGRLVWDVANLGISYTIAIILRDQ